MTKKASWFASMLLFALTASISAAVAQLRKLHRKMRPQLRRIIPP
jgi:hypothetical protein